MGVWYTTREAVKRALDTKETARNDVQVDRAIEASSRAVEGFLRRTFAPTLETRYFDWPNEQYARPWRLWITRHDLISVTTLSAAGTTISSSDYFLEPINSGPPYDRVEIDLSSSAAFSGTSTHQRSIAITGLWGYTDDNTAVGTVAEALDASETAVDVDGATAALVGVGSVIRLDAERMLVTGRSTLTTGQTLQSDLTAQNNSVTVAVTNGAAFAIGETILLDSERMLIVDIAGNSLTVKRGWDGSVVAAHSGSTIYGYRTLTVARGALGSTAATHSSGTTLYRWDVPGPVSELALAEAVNNLDQLKSGYVQIRRAGDDSEKRMSVAPLIDLRTSVFRSHGLKGRLGAI
jgi:hypothetical protein